MSEGALAIDVHGLGKRLGGRWVVRGVDLQLRSGRICGFLGPNGSGKTTTLRLLCGLLAADEGGGTCLGLDLRSQGIIIRHGVGYMTQRFGLYEDLSVRENLDFVARLYACPQRKQVVETQMQRLGLDARAEQVAGTLSGGWKQRLALAACLIHQPRLLLLDEPTAGVDPHARREFWAELKAQAAAGLTVLVCTHYMDEALRCDELIYLAWGQVRARGSPAELAARSDLSPASEVARLEDYLASLMAREPADPQHG